MKTDARVRYTKMVIKNSFCKILEKKPLTKVTVKEICEMSEINRATFYKYYCDPYDLLDKIEHEFLVFLFYNVGQSIPNGFKEIFTFILVSIKAEGEVYRTLFSENGDPHLPGVIVSSCYQKYAAIDNDTGFQNLDTAKKAWLFYFIAQGCSGILSQWMENEMKEPICEVADFADKLIQSTLQAL